jgi:hypothetical protein
MRRSMSFNALIIASVLRLPCRMQFVSPVLTN